MFWKDIVNSRVVAVKGVGGWQNLARVAGIVGG
jgi:hypothetical protein